MLRYLRKPLALACVALTLPVFAATNPIQESYRAQAKLDNSAFKEFSAAAGEKFYNAKGAELSCASCHTSRCTAVQRRVGTSAGSSVTLRSR